MANPGHSKKLDDNLTTTYRSIMLSSSVQPSVVSLLSSTGSDPLSLFSVQTDSSLPSDSLIHLLNDSTSSPEPPQPAALIQPPPAHGETAGYSLNQSVIHIQAPNIPTTFIRCPAEPDAVKNGSRTRSTRRDVLGMKHPWLHIQARNMGREWSFEIGIVDQSGREGILRCSTFQVSVFITCCMYLMSYINHSLSIHNVC